MSLHGNDVLRNPVVEQLRFGKKKERDQFFVSDNPDERAADLASRNGGFKSHDPRNRKSINQLKIDIASGKITISQARNAQIRHPDAAVELEGVIQGRAKQEDILKQASPVTQPALTTETAEPGIAHELGTQLPLGETELVAEERGDVNLDKAIQGAISKGDLKFAERLSKLRSSGRAKPGKEDPTFNRALKLRQEVGKKSKSFRDSRDAHNRVLASASDPSGAGDLALIFNFMKVLDPRSVVRESEFANAEITGAKLEANGVPKFIVQWRNKILNGQRITARQRNDFVDRSKKLFTAIQKTHFGDIKEIRRIAARFRIPPDLVALRPQSKSAKKTKSVQKKRETIKFSDLPK
jgi:hypothetical protein